MDRRRLRVSSRNDGLAWWFSFLILCVIVQSEQIFFDEEMAE